MNFNLKCETEIQGLALLIHPFTFQSKYLINILKILVLVNKCSLSEMIETFVNNEKV